MVANKAKAWLCGSMLVTLTAGNLGCDKDKMQSPSPAASQEATFSVSSTEKAFMQRFAENDFRSWAETGKMSKNVNPADAPNVIRVDADTLQNDYAANEVSADLKYRDKYLLVTGVVLSIDRSVGANYFLRLKGGKSPFNSPNAQMANDTVNYLAGLKKGQTVTLYGKCDGMLMKSVSLKGCEPSGVWASAYTKEYIQKYVEELPALIKTNNSRGVRLGILAARLSSVLLPKNPLIEQPINEEGGYRCEEVALDILFAVDQPEEEVKKEYKKYKVSNRFDLTRAILQALENDPDMRGTRAYLVPSIVVKDSTGAETTVLDLASKKYGPLAKSFTID